MLRSIVSSSTRRRLAIWAGGSCKVGKQKLPPTILTKVPKASLKILKPE